MTAYSTVPELIIPVPGGNALQNSMAASIAEGDIISITELLHGQHICAKYNNKEHRLVFYDKNMQLIATDNVPACMLEGNIEPFERYKDCIFHGIYTMTKGREGWHLFDVYDNSKRTYMTQGFVKGFGEKFKFMTVYEFYFGLFMGWDMLYGFVQKCDKGKGQDGIVIKNQTRMKAHAREFTYKLLK